MNVVNPNYLKMILYSVTLNIEKDVHDEGLVWMKSVHVPSVMKTGLFLENKILRLLNEEELNTGITYSFQYFLKDLTALEIFQKDFEDALDAELYKKYRNKFVEFRTVLEVL